MLIRILIIGILLISISCSNSSENHTEIDKDLNALEKNKNQDEAMESLVDIALKTPDKLIKYKKRLEALFVKEKGSIMCELGEILSIIGDRDTLEILKQKLSKTKHGKARTYLKGSIGSLEKKLDAKK